MIDIHLTEALGYIAAGLVLGTFASRSTVTLRSVAIASNLMFIAYAACAYLPPVLVLHALPLALGVLTIAARTRQAAEASRRIGAWSRRCLLSTFYASKASPSASALWSRTTRSR